MKRRGLQGSLKSSLGVQMIKNLPAIQETRVRSLGPDDALRRKFSSILTWRIPWTEEPGGLQSMELPSVRHEGLMLSLESCGVRLPQSIHAVPSRAKLCDRQVTSSLCASVSSLVNGDNHSIQLLGLLWDKYAVDISSGPPLASFALTPLEGFEEWS